MTKMLSEPLRRRDRRSELSVTRRVIGGVVLGSDVEVVLGFVRHDAKTQRCPYLPVDQVRAAPPMVPGTNRDQGVSEVDAAQGLQRQSTMVPVSPN